MGKKAEYGTDRDLAFLLVDTARKLNDAYDANMKPLGLTRSQWRVVAYVSRTPGITQTQLATNVEVSRMAITGLLDRMQAKDLVERRFAPNDRRVKTVHLTARSEALVSRMNKAARVVLKGVFSGMSPVDKAGLVEALGTVKNNAATVEAATADR